MTLYQAEVFPNPEILTPLPAKRVVSPSASALLSRAGGWGSECVECLGTRPRTTARHGCVSAGAPVLRGRASVPRRAHACTCRMGSPSRARAAPRQDDTGGFNVWGAEELLRAVLLWGLVLSEPALTEVPCELPQTPWDPQAGGRCGSQPGRSVPGTPSPLLRRRRPQAPFRPRWRDSPASAGLPG